MDELERIAFLSARFRRPSRDVRVGIGDDAAVLQIGGDLVTTVDASVEGVHFRRAWAGLDRLAARAFTAAASDLAAMGAGPAGALLSLVLPSSVDDEAFAALVEGAARSAEAIGCPIVGGNLSAGGELSITTTVLGISAGAVLTRGGARPGDVLYVTGAPGDRALGLEVLLAGRASSGDTAGVELAEAWLDPVARIEEGRALVGRASAAIDVSDGLLSDLGHLCRASGVGAHVDVDAVPRHPRFDEVARAVGVDPFAVLLGGGEAYELLFAAPPGVDLGIPCAAIGRIHEGDAIDALRGGRPVAIPRDGYRHFR